MNGESEQEVAVITREINLLIDEEIKRFKETREESMIYDDMPNMLRREVDKVENRTYVWVSLIFQNFRTTQSAKNQSCFKS